MNRWDEIQGAARDIADWVCGDPADRNRMADDLIKLVCLVVQGVGKGVAIEGETSMNGPDSEAEAGGARYLVGEDIQNSASTVLEESSNAGCDLERYERDGLTAAWTADPTKRGAAHRFAPGELSRAAHRAADAMRAQKQAPPVPDERPSSHPMFEFNPAADTLRPYLSVDRCPECDRKILLGHMDNCSQRSTAGCTGGQPGIHHIFGHNADCAPAATVKHPLQLCDAQDCPAHGDRGRVGPCVRDGRQHVWVTVLEGDPDTLVDWVCNTCRTAGCGAPWITGTTLCNGDPYRATHGNTDARCCSGPPVQVPVVLHSWVTATDGDTGVFLDWKLCGVCGVRRCDGSCGDASVGAAPDADCQTHGTDDARRCNG